MPMVHQIYTTKGLHQKNYEYLFKQSALPFSIIFAVDGSSFSSTISMHIPRLSIPRRPARPLIWMYSPLDNHLNLSPSNLRTLVNTTVFAGMFNPMLNVSVANRHWGQKGKINKIKSLQQLNTKREHIRQEWWYKKPWF